MIERLEPRQLLAADVVISEFLASNSTGLVDKFGDHSDWIEIHNRGSSSANLNDYLLTDDPSKSTTWRFPVQSLAAGGYLVVFATSRNLAVAGQELHTNFKLSAVGEYLGLLSASDKSSVFEFAPTFPVQSTDVSYGLLDDNVAGSALGYFSTPTPGSHNVADVATPTFSQSGKVFSSSFSLTISDATPGADIRFTVDGSVPTQSSLQYISPLSISQDTQLRVRAFKTGYSPSLVTTQYYTYADSTTSSFNSNLPVVVIDTYGSTIGDTSFVSAGATFIDTTTSNRATMTGTTPNYLGNIGIHVRGQSTEGYPKLSYAVETRDEAGEDKDVSLLGMPAESDWVLYAPYAEKSLLQNPLAFELDNQLGHYASRTRYVEVFLNNGDGKINYADDYQGIYVLMEKIKIGPDRVNITKLGPADNTAPNVTGGYIFKRDKLDVGETGFRTTSGTLYENVEPDVNDITPQQQSYLTQYLSDFDTALNGPNFKDPVNGYAKYIDVDSWIDNYLMVESLKNVDGLRVSTYFYKDRNGKIKMEPLWDYNVSMGNADFLGGQDTTGFYTDQFPLGYGDYDLAFFPRLKQDPAFVQKIEDRWQQIRKTVFSDASIDSDINAFVSLLSDNSTNYPVGQYPNQPATNALVRNFQRWNTLGVHIEPNALIDPNGSYIAEVNLTRTWLHQRFAWIDSQFTPQPTITPIGGQRSTPVSVTIAPPNGSVLILYTTDGTDPRLADGSVNPTAKLYNGAFTLTSTTRVRARSYLSGSWSGMDEEVYSFDQPTLRVTEIMYNPPAPSDTTQQQNYEYIELKNVGTASILLDGYAFTKGVTFTFPSQSLAAGAYVVVAKDAAAFAARYGSSIVPIGYYSGNLDNDGEEIILANGLGVQQDFSYNDSWYKTTDGNGYSLVIRNPADPTLADWGTSPAWRPSANFNGSPGVVDPNPTLTANFSGVSASLAAPIDSANLTFVNPVTGFDLSDLSLTRNGETSSLAGATITTTDNIHFTIANLTALTQWAGNYVLTLNASGSGISDGAQALASNAAASFKITTPNFKGTATADNYLLRRNATTGALEVFENNSNITGTPDYTIASASTLNVTFDGGAGNDIVIVDAGNGAPYASMNLQGGIGTDELRVIGDATGITAGGNSVTLAGKSLTHGGFETLSVSGSTTTTVINGDLNGLNLNLISGAMTITASQHIGALTLGAATRATVSNGGKLIVVKNLSIPGNSIFDLSNNDMIWDYTGATKLPIVNAMIAAARTGGSWSGTTGLTSSVAAANSKHNTSLAAVEASDYESIASGNTSFDGELLDASAVVIKYTFNGDADLNGKVNADDYARIDAGYQTQRAPGFVFSWFNGDFDYNGVINADDYALIDSAYQTQGSGLSVAVMAPPVATLPKVLPKASIPMVSTRTNRV